VLTSSLVVLEVVVAGEQADYVAFCEEIRPEWDYLHIAACMQSYTIHSQTNALKLQENLTFAWCLNEDSNLRYEVTFQNGADFWCFLWHLTKPLPHT
jgi:hypothetical protein